MGGRRGLISLMTAWLFLPVFLIAQEPRPSTPGAEPAARSANPETLPQLTPSEIEIYKSAPTLINWSPSEIQHCAFLHGLEPAGSQEQLPGILQRVGQACTHSLDDFLNVSCDEEVVSRGASSYSVVRRDFHYIVVRRPRGDLRVFEEYRTDLKGDLLNSSTFWDFSMITWGFASSWVVLSPGDQPDSRFRYFGTQTIRNRECLVVGFAQDPERPCNLGEFRSQGRSVNVVVQGLAWIDSQTFQVLRVTTWLLAPRKDVGLNSQTSTVDFYPVRPTGAERELWLPRDVRVDAIFRGLKIRNTHHYSNYKLFRVESTIKP